jgi:glycogen debranching enzyme
MPTAPEHAREQLFNDIAAQQDDGFLPGSIYWDKATIRYSRTQGHPPVWVYAVDQYYAMTGSKEFLKPFYRAAVKQLDWFEKHRKADGEGYFYTDILTHQWESGVDEGIRFLDVKTGKFACIDATAHVYQMYDLTAKWAAILGKDPDPFKRRADQLREFIQTKMFDSGTGFFYDAWAMQDQAKRHYSYEGLWPVIVGAATPEQARRVIDENILKPDRFFCAHPVATVGVRDLLFELRMWRGPAWNSMTYWVALGCMRYDRSTAAAALVERALDDSAAQFKRTATIWEFYHPQGGKPEDLRRKPNHPQPCPDYLGHNPLFAMARLYDRVKEQKSSDSVPTGL